MTTSVDGYPVWQAMYAPFGIEVSPQMTVNEYKFAGLTRDPTTGLDQAMLRAYSSTINRWMSPDPLGGDVTNPQSLNRYAYALNNPTTLTDPLGLDGGMPDCSDLEYSITHAECAGPPLCVANGTEGCIPPPVGFPVGGGGGGGGGPATSTPPPAQAPTTAAGNDFIHNPYPCLTPAQQGLLANFLLGAAAALLHLPPSQVQAAKVKPISVHGGALNVQIAIDPTKGLSVSPDVIANAGRSNPVFEPQDPFEVRSNEIVPVGPGTSVHVVFNTTTNAAGQTVISDARVHADIGNPDSGAGGVLRHVLLDFAAASVFSAAQQGVPGGIPGCPVKFQ